MLNMCLFSPCLVDGVCVGTMRQRASSRSPKHTGGGDGTMVRHVRKLSPNDAGGSDGTLNNNAGGTLVRTRQNSNAGIRHHRKASSGAVDTGTMVRHNRPSSRRNSFASDEAGGAEGLELSGKSLLILCLLLSRLLYRISTLHISNAFLSCVCLAYINQEQRISLGHPIKLKPIQVYNPPCVTSKVMLPVPLHLLLNLSVVVLRHHSAIIIIMLLQLIHQQEHHPLPRLRRFLNMESVEVPFQWLKEVRGGQWNHLHRLIPL